MARDWTIEDFRTSAKDRLPRFLFEYLEGGALNEQTLARNSFDYEGLAIRQRVLGDVSRVDTAIDLFGTTSALPLALSPVGMAGMYARRGEAQAARAAARARIPFTLSTVSICDLAEVQYASGTPAWFQLYVTRDRGFMSATIQRAQALGASALIMTVDMPVPGTRYRDKRTGLSGSFGWRQSISLYAQAMLRPGWAWDVGLRGRPHSFATVAASAEGDFGIAGFWGRMADNFDATVGWSDIEQVRSLWHGPLLIKGILDPEDARRAVALGADGIIVSNHGGRQLDGAPSTIRALGPIRDALGESPKILVDGGIRSGVDLFRALAMGATAGMIGRPWVYALAADGGRGVERLVATIRDELAITMALAGKTGVAAIDRSALLI